MKILSRQHNIMAGDIFILRLTLAYVLAMFIGVKPDTLKQFFAEVMDWFLQK